MIIKPEKVETWGNGLEVYAIPCGAVAAVADGTMLVRGNRTYTVGTCSGSAVRRFHLPFGCVDNGEPVCRPGIDSMVWINANASVICSGRHPNDGRKALRVEVGQQVWLEGALYTITAENNDNLGLEPVTES